MSTPQTIFIIGATGRTGSSIVDSLLGDPKFHVIADIRPVSTSKPAVEALKARGTEIRIVDLEASSVEQLQEQLKDVDIVISAIEWTQFHLQTPLINASKNAGVKRFIPCESYHELIKKLDLAYTFIDVGWWFQVTVPIMDSAKEPCPSTAELSKTIYGTGDVKLAVTEYRGIGKFVARIVSDDRTLNKYVFFWGEEYTQKEVFALAERILGRPIPTKQIAAEDLAATISGFAPGSLEQSYFQYFYSLFVRGDNTVEKAKKEEFGSALDARELCPDLKPRSLEAFAREYYSE